MLLDIGDFFANMNVATITCIVILVVFAFIGRMKGVARMIVMLISIVLATVTVALLVNLVDNLIKENTGEWVQALVFLVLIAFLFWIFYFIGKALKILRNLPIVHGLDCFLGMILGLGLGVLVILVMFVVLQRYDLGGVNAYWIEQIQANPILNWFYENNPIKNFLFK